MRGANETTTGIRLLTTGFEIIAECDLGGQRISDLMNQTLTDYLECSNAKLFRRGRFIESIEHLKVRKTEIMIGGIVGVFHEAPEKQMGNHRNLGQYQAIAAVDRWIIKGRLHMTSHKSVTEFLHSNRDFFPIAKALITDAESPERPDEMKVAIVNRTRVAFMEITETDETGSLSGAVFDHTTTTA